MRPKKHKKNESRPSFGSIYVSSRKSRIPSLSRHSYLVEIRSQNSRLPLDLAGSLRFFFLLQITMSQLEQARAS